MISVPPIGMGFCKLCKGTHTSTCYLIQGVLKQLSFSLMLHRSGSLGATFVKSFHFFGRRLEHLMSYIDNKIPFSSVVFHYTL